MRGCREEYQQCTRYAGEGNMEFTSVKERLLYPVNITECGIKRAPLLVMGV